MCWFSPRIWLTKGVLTLLSLVFLALGTIAYAQEVGNEYIIGMPGSVFKANIVSFSWDNGCNCYKGVLDKQHPLGYPWYGSNIVWRDSGNGANGGLWVPTKPGAIKDPYATNKDNFGDDNPNRSQIRNVWNQNWNASHSTIVTRFNEFGRFRTPSPSRINNCSTWGLYSQSSFCPEGIKQLELDTANRGYCKTNCDNTFCVEHYPDLCLEQCQNTQKDENKNGTTWCDDPFCQVYYPACSPEANCTDGNDNDIDGMTDLADPDCEEKCWDNTDTDGDGNKNNGCFDWPTGNAYDTCMRQDAYYGKLYSPQGQSLTKKGIKATELLDLLQSEISNFDLTSTQNYHESCCASYTEDCYKSCKSQWIEEVCGFHDACDIKMPSAYAPSPNYVTTGFQVQYVPECYENICPGINDKLDNAFAECLSNTPTCQTVDSTNSESDISKEEISKYQKISCTTEDVERFYALVGGELAITISMPPQIPGISFLTPANMQAYKNKIHPNMTWQQYAWSQLSQDQKNLIYLYVVWFGNVFSLETASSGQITDMIDIWIATPATLDEYNEIDAIKNFRYTLVQAKVKNKNNKAIMDQLNTLDHKCLSHIIMIIENTSWNNPYGNNAQYYVGDPKDDVTHSSEGIQQLNVAMNNAGNNIMEVMLKKMKNKQNIRKLSDADTLAMLNCMVINMMQYDKSVNDDDHCQKPGTWSNPAISLCAGNGVCADYANITYTLGKALGLDIEYVMNLEMTHAYNTITLEGTSYIFEPQGPWCTLIPISVGSTTNTHPDTGGANEIQIPKDERIVHTEEILPEQLPPVPEVFPEPEDDDTQRQEGQNAPSSEREEIHTVADKRTDREQTSEKEETEGRAEEVLPDFTTQSIDKQMPLTPRQRTIICLWVVILISGGVLYRQHRKH